MTSEADPIVDAWYHYPEKAQKFRVSAIDDHTATVAIQYFDGNIDELDLDAWYELDIERIEEPEDWTGPLDNVEEEDTGMQREERDEPYREVDEKRRAGPREPDGMEETGDDWDEGQPQEEPRQDRE